MIRNPILIRKATSNDTPMLAILTEQLGYKIPLSVLRENVRAYLLDAERALFVAIANENVVGYIALDAAQTFHRLGKHMRIVSLVVDDRYRGQGIGKSLLRTAEDWAKQQNCWAIEVTSSFRRQKEGAHDFYMNQGYQKDGSAYFRKLMELPSRSDALTIT